MNETPTQPGIIDFDGVIIFMMHFPRGPLLKLIPPPHIQKDLKIKVDARATRGDKFFMITIDSYSIKTQEEWDEAVCYVVEFVWAELVARKLVTGSMPDVESGEDVLDMLTLLRTK